MGYTVIIILALLALAASAAVILGKLGRRQPAAGCDKGRQRGAEGGTSEDSGSPQQAFAAATTAGPIPYGGAGVPLPTAPCPPAPEAEVRTAPGKANPQLALPVREVVVAERAENDSPVRLADQRGRSGSGRAQPVKPKAPTPDQDTVTVEPGEANLGAMGVATGTCTPEGIARLEQKIRTTPSYPGPAKRATSLGFGPAGSLDNIRWKKLEEQINDELLYERLLRRRQQISTAVRGASR